jgi:hypothetical protein
LQLQEREQQLALVRSRLDLVGRRK